MQERKEKGSYGMRKERKQKEEKTMEKGNGKGNIWQGIKTTGLLLITAGIITIKPLLTHKRRRIW